MFLLTLLLVGLLGCGGEPADGATSAGLTATDPGAPSTSTEAGSTESGSALAALSDASRAAVAGAPVERVLLLPAAYLGDAVVTSGPHFFAISARHEDLTISLHATDVVHHALPDDAVLPEAELAVRGRPARESMNDGIRGVTWTEAGMTYDLEIECFEALTDPRCTENGFVRDLAESLLEHSR